MLMVLNEYKKYLSWKYRFWFKGCVVRYHDLFVFILESSYTDAQVREEEDNGWDSSLRPKGRLIFDLSKEPGSQWSGGFMYNWQPMVIGAAEKPLSQAIMIEQHSAYPSLDHKCYVTGSGPAYEDIPLASMGPTKGENGNFMRGGIAKLKTLDGYLYACGAGRAIGKRLGKGQWQSFSQNIPNESGGNKGFDDFDGYGENDIYAVGGMGDVWHFDGKAWQQIPFPSNYPLSAVCCGGDGQVYIAGYNGIFIGRGNSWKRIGGISTTLPIKDMVWYEDKVWCTNDYGLWTIDNGRVARADVPAEISACAGSLSVGDGVLLLAGLYGAVFKENGQWQVIVHFNVMETLKALEERQD